MTEIVTKSTIKSLLDTAGNLLNIKQLKLHSKF